MRYEPESAAVDATDAPPEIPCPVAIGAITDERFLRDSIGLVFAPIVGGDPIPWVRACMGSYLKVGGAMPSTGTNSAAPADAILLDVKLIRVHCRSLPIRSPRPPDSRDPPVTIRASVAMIVQFRTAGIEVRERLYRGEAVLEKARFFADATWGPRPEFVDTAIMDALNRAMEDALSRVCADLADLCPDGAH